MFELAVTSSRNAGYLIWFPDFSGKATGDGTHGSLYLFAQDVASGTPTNTVADPLGSFTSTTTGAFIEDPATTFIEGDFVNDSRTVAACIKLMYTGTNDNCSGRIGYLTDVPREALLSGGSSGGPPSIEQMFRYSNRSERTPLDGAEIKFRPGTGSDNYRSSDHVESDQGFIVGTTDASVTSVPSGSPSGDCHGIGFAWAGLTDNQSVVFDFLKAIEWRPTMASGISTPAPTTAIGGGNLVSKAITFLDRHQSGWQTAATKVFKTLGASVAGMAARGAENQIIRTGAQLALTML